MRGPTRNAQAQRAAGCWPPSSTRRCPGERASAPSTPESHRCRAQAPGSDARQCARARRARTSQTGLTSRPRRETVARGRHLVGIDREHPQPCVQQPLDQQPVRALDRDQLNPQAREHLAQRLRPASSCAYVAARSFSPAPSDTRTSCCSDAQSIPATLPIVRPLLRSRPLLTATTGRYHCGRL